MFFLTALLSETTCATNAQCRRRCCDRCSLSNYSANTTTAPV